MTAARTAAADVETAPAESETPAATYANGTVIDSPTVNAFVVGVEIVEGDQPDPPPVDPPAGSEG